jgi:uncharacterized protein DUF6088
MGDLIPTPDAVARALANGRDVQVSGARAANALGLSTQVPVKPVYLVDGVTRDVKLTVGRQVIRLKHAGLRDRVGRSDSAGTTLQALRHLGRKGVDDKAIRHLRIILGPDVKQSLRKQLSDPLLVDWLRPVIEQIAPGKVKSNCG